MRKPCRCAPISFSPWSSGSSRATHSYRLLKIASNSRRKSSTVPISKSSTTAIGRCKVRPFLELGTWNLELGTLASGRDVADVEILGRARLRHPHEPDPRHGARNRLRAVHG